MTGSAMTEEMPHILVVDDDLRLREVLRKYLMKNGFVVTTAQDAADARAKLESLAFDLLVLDVMMPGESGLELTEKLRRDSQVPILLLTARGELDDRIAGLEAGADDYMSKPFEPRELVLRIGSILRRVPRPVEPMADLRIGALDLRAGPGRTAPRRRDRPPDQRRGGLAARPGEPARLDPDPRGTGRPRRDRRQRPHGGRSGQPASQQTGGRPPPSALSPYRAWRGLCTETGMTITQR